MDQKDNYQSKTNTRISRLPEKEEGEEGGQSLLKEMIAENSNLGKLGHTSPQS